MLADSYRLLQQTQKPLALLVKKETFASYKPAEKEDKSGYPMKRIDALGIISQHFQEGDLVFSTTGKLSRELFSINDRPQNFYMQGSMGHIASLAFGTAISQPQRPIWVLDGDGSFLMHLGATSMIGHYCPPNFYHLVLDNEAYESTGNQETTSKTTDIAAIARACGYTTTSTATNREGLASALAQLKHSAGPALLRIKINALETFDIPRISSKHSSQCITANFRSCLVTGNTNEGLSEDYK
jgi:phosphonopyruvate decarboxylase